MAQAPGSDPVWAFYQESWLLPHKGTCNLPRHSRFWGESSSKICRLWDISSSLFANAVGNDVIGPLKLQESLGSMLDQLYPRNPQNHLLRKEFCLALGLVNSFSGREVGSPDHSNPSAFVENLMRRVQTWLWLHWMCTWKDSPGSRLLVHSAPRLLDGDVLSCMRGECRSRLVGVERLKCWEPK